MLHLNILISLTNVMIITISMNVVKHFSSDRFIGFLEVYK
jgi:hypothetical protein